MVLLKNGINEENFKIYKSKRDVMRALGVGLTDYKMFKRCLDRGEIYEVFYGNRVGYVDFYEVSARVNKELGKKVLQNRKK